MTQIEYHLLSRNYITQSLSPGKTPQSRLLFYLCHNHSWCNWMVLEQRGISFLPNRPRPFYRVLSCESYQPTNPSRCVKLANPSGRCRGPQATPLESAKACEATFEKKMVSRFLSPRSRRWLFMKLHVDSMRRFFEGSQAAYGYAFGFGISWTCVGTWCMFWLI